MLKCFNSDLTIFVVRGNWIIRQAPRADRFPVMMVYPHLRSPYIHFFQTPLDLNYNIRFTKVNIAN